jgi:hypothetical protein
VRAIDARFLLIFPAWELTSTLLPGVLWAKVEEQKSARISKEMLRAAASVAGCNSRSSSSIEC